MNEIGEKIKKLRIQKCLKNVELADMAGISYVAEIGIEKGRYKPSELMIAKIARALGYSYEEFITLEVGDDVAKCTN